MKFIILATILLSCILLTQSAKKFRNAPEQCNKYKGKITEKDKFLILQLHNDFRNQIATQTAKTKVKLPFAQNMIQMYWSEELALKAQDWANKCSKNNSDIKTREHPKFSVGENIFSFETSGGNPKPEWKQAISDWFNQNKSFNNKPVNKFMIAGTATEAFTQLIWAQTYWVGCGFSLSTTPKGKLSLYVCQYGPGGNIRDQPIYIQGNKKECKCLQGMACKNPKWPGLCCPDGFCTEKTLSYTGEPFPGTAKKN